MKFPLFRNASEQSEVTHDYRQLSKLTMVSVLTAVLFLCTALFGMFITSAPSFPQEGINLQIEQGSSVRSITLKAKEQGIVRSSLVLYTILTYSENPTGIYAGTYSFKQPLSVFEVAQKLTQNDIDHTLVSITIPEGVTRKEIARIAESKLPAFDSTRFLELTKNTEGFLFPETYFVAPDFTAEALVDLLTETFTAKLSLYNEEINKSSFTEYEILILASILEREANDEESMRMVSGILQNRLAIGMALQTDASIEYVLDKPLQELLPEDLEIDTPYNTYLYNGLTPTPIGNPGELAIKAVLYPIESDYMFYITGNDGLFYYAKTFAEHKQNVQRYLR